jgi:lysophospholipase
MDALREACDRGVIIVAISQCQKGAVSDAYESGRTLLKAGVVPGGDMTPEVSLLSDSFGGLTHMSKCALTKLSYLLSKSEFSVSDIRGLMGTPLRGELTGPLGLAPNPPPTIESSLEHIQGVLSHFVRLSAAPTVSSPKIPDSGASTSAASWSWTAAEAMRTESVLLPLLIHLAAARDDIESMTECIVKGGDSVGGSLIPGGIANCLSVTSSQSPLHVAAINNSKRCVHLLLRSGALVHLRDAQGHTALYYVSTC